MSFDHCKDIRETSYDYSGLSPGAAYELGRSDERLSANKWAEVGPKLLAAVIRYWDFGNIPAHEYTAKYGTSGVSVHKIIGQAIREAESI